MVSWTFSTPCGPKHTLTISLLPSSFSWSFRCADTCRGRGQQCVVRTDGHRQGKPHMPYGQPGAPVAGATPLEVLASHVPWPNEGGVQGCSACLGHFLFSQSNLLLCRESSKMWATEREGNPGTRGLKTSSVYSGTSQANCLTGAGLKLPIAHHRVFEYLHHRNWPVLLAGLWFCWRSRLSVHPRAPDPAW